MNDSAPPRFLEVSPITGIDQDPGTHIETHGTLFADYDLDGLVDVLTVNRLAPSKLYHNISDTAPDADDNKWLHIKLIGDPLQYVAQDAIAVVATASRVDAFLFVILKLVESESHGLRICPIDARLFVRKGRKVYCSRRCTNLAMQRRARKLAEEEAEEAAAKATRKK